MVERCITAHCIFCNHGLCETTVSELRANDWVYAKQFGVYRKWYEFLPALGDRWLRSRLLKALFPRHYRQIPNWWHREDSK